MYDVDDTLDKVECLKEVVYRDRVDRSVAVGSKSRGLWPLYVIDNRNAQPGGRVSAQSYRVSARLLL